MAFLNENGLHALRECCDALYLKKTDASDIYLSKTDAKQLPYLPLSGGIMTGQIQQTNLNGNTSYSYWNSKNTCCLYTANTPDANHYFPVVGMKSVDGSTLSIGATAGNTNAGLDSVMSFVYNPKDNTAASSVKQIRMDIKQNVIEASSTSLASYNSKTLTYTAIKNVGDKDSCVYFSGGIPAKGRTIKCGTGTAPSTGMAVGDIYIKYE